MAEINLPESRELAKTVESLTSKSVVALNDDSRQQLKAASGVLSSIDVVLKSVPEDESDTILELLADLEKSVVESQSQIANALATGTMEDTRLGEVSFKLDVINATLTGAETISLADVMNNLPTAETQESVEQESIDTTEAIRQLVEAVPTEASDVQLQTVMEEIKNSLDQLVLGQKEAELEAELDPEEDASGLKKLLAKLPGTSTGFFSDLFGVPELLMLFRPVKDLLAGFTKIPGLAKTAVGAIKGIPTALGGLTGPLSNITGVVGKLGVVGAAAGAAFAGFKLGEFIGENEEIQGAVVDALGGINSSVGGFVNDLLFGGAQIKKLQRDLVGPGQKTLDKAERKAREKGFSSFAEFQEANKLDPENAIRGKAFVLDPFKFEREKLDLTKEQFTKFKDEEREAVQAFVETDSPLTIEEFKTKFKEDFKTRGAVQVESMPAKLPRMAPEAEAEKAKAITSTSQLQTSQGVNVLGQVPTTIQRNPVAPSAVPADRRPTKAPVPIALEQSDDETRLMNSGRF